MAGYEKEDAHVEQFLIAKPVAIFLNQHQIADQIISGASASCDDDLFEMPD